MIAQALMQFYDKIIKLHEDRNSFNLTKWERLRPM